MHLLIRKLSKHEFTTIFLQLLSATSTVRTVLTNVLSQIPAIARTTETALRLADQHQLATLASDVNFLSSTAIVASNVIPQLLTTTSTTIQTITETATHLFSGATTTSEPAVQLSKTNNAPTSQDLQATTNTQLQTAPVAPVLSTQFDSVPSTDPACPIVVETSAICSLNHLNAPANFNGLLNENEDITDQIWEHIEPEQFMIIADQLDDFLRRMHMLIPQITPNDEKIKTYIRNLPLLQNNHWIGRLISG